MIAICSTFHPFSKSVRGPRNIHKVHFLKLLSHELECFIYFSTHINTWITTQSINFCLNFGQVLITGIVNDTSPNTCYFEINLLNFSKNEATLARFDNWINWHLFVFQSCSKTVGRDNEIIVFLVLWISVCLHMVWYPMLCS